MPRGVKGSTVTPEQKRARIKEWHLAHREERLAYYKKYYRRRRDEGDARIIEELGAIRDGLVLLIETMKNGVVLARDSAEYRRESYRQQMLELADAFAAQ